MSCMRCSLKAYLYACPYPSPYPCSYLCLCTYPSCCCMFCLQCGRMPFAVHEQQSLNMYIEQVTGDMQQRRFALPPRLSADAADLLRQLLHPNPTARITIAGAQSSGLTIKLHLTSASCP